MGCFTLGFRVRVSNEPLFCVELEGKGTGIVHFRVQPLEVTHN